MSRSLKVHTHLAIDMIHRYVKITHGLSWMKITRKNPIHTCLRYKVCNQFGSNGFTPLCLEYTISFKIALLETSFCQKKKGEINCWYLSISSCVSKIGNHSSNFLSGSSSASIHHDQQLHEILISRSASRLHQEDIAASNTLFELNVDLPISKPLDANLAKLQAHIPSNFLHKRERERELAKV